MADGLLCFVVIPILYSFIAFLLVCDLEFLEHLVFIQSISVPFSSYTLLLQLSVEWDVDK